MTHKVTRGQIEAFVKALTAEAERTGAWFDDDGTHGQVGAQSPDEINYDGRFNIATLIEAVLAPPQGYIEAGDVRFTYDTRDCVPLHGLRVRLASGVPVAGTIEPLRLVLSGVAAEQVLEAMQSGRKIKVNDIEYSVTSAAVERSGHTSFYLEESK
jgi:hypothetical protein